MGNTDQLLNSINYIVFWLQPSGKLIAKNSDALQLTKNLSNKNHNIKSLFNLDNYQEAINLANSHEKRPVKLDLTNNQQKKLLWEFIPGKNGIACLSLNIEHSRLSNKDEIPDSNIHSEILLNILPKYIVDTLVTKKSVPPKVFRHTTILFTDVVNFSKLSFHLDPVSLIRKLGLYYLLHDSIMDEYKIEKIKTIGDSYMCVSGVPVKKKSHTVDCCLAALKLLHELEQTEKPENIVEEVDLNNWKFRVGIHTGPCISGVLGVKKYRFDIWGDSVNIAARMQAAGSAGKINISENTYNEVKHIFECSFRGEQEIKNIGIIKMYFLNRLKPEYSGDNNGSYPNMQFKKEYYEKYWSKARKETICSQPLFIKDYIKEEL
jgi:class 3 adenylate cyclase